MAGTPECILPSQHAATNPLIGTTQRAARKKIHNGIDWKKICGTLETYIHFKDSIPLPARRSPETVKEREREREGID
jgi:hypothetical protein